MNTKHLRISAATVMAAIALGVAAPAAGAAEIPQAPVAHSRSAAPLELTPAQARLVLQTPEVADHLSAGERAEVQALADSESHERVKRGLGGSAAKAAWATIKKAGPGTVDAAKKGGKGLKARRSRAPWSRSGRTLTPSSSTGSTSTPGDGGTSTVRQPATGYGPAAKWTSPPAPTGAPWTTCRRPPRPSPAP
ncbi:hypothetical protein ABZ769_27045 [Streptomyces olivoreticuli]